MREAEKVLDEEVNKSFDAYLHGRLHCSGSGRYDGHEGGEGDSGYSSADGSEGENGFEDAMMMMSEEEKETRKELRRLVGVVEELRGVFFKKTGKYLPTGEKGSGSDGNEDGEVEDLVAERLLMGNGEADGKSDGQGEDAQMALKRLAARLGMGKREESQMRGCRL